MFRFMPSILLAPVFAISLVGCVSKPATQVSTIDYAKLSYEGVSFSKPGVSATVQAASFRTDIDACAAIAEEQYQKSLASSAQLSQLYGQAMKPETFQALKKPQVVACMSGMKGSNDQGKGWVVVR
ncbi:hypothetical protein [Pseudomonas cichorii]|uniref:hypothetical protein n=1 Tax=Pseudomonas cichorii TaxID=36746 RepID=UPI001C898E00|nr:hypothetical protein [Pseudomonas cichorii]MBX8528807.1 hypothetical protein [Pseudomonas cichorii]MBX8573540.1 hypothetical protein [Pseudomonas cichorii]